MKTRKAIVFGGAGFLGSHVADQLTLKGYDVTVFDRVESPWIVNSQTMIVGDILNKEDVDNAVSGCDYVCNFAALADINDAMLRPVDTVKTNILGTVNILEACRRYKVERFIFASTVYTYSRDGGFYRCSKQAAEQYIEQYGKTYGLEYTVLRFGSLYGPRSDCRNGLYRIVRDAVTSNRVKYSGSPESVREYIHVKDAARASVEALAAEFVNQHIVLTGADRVRVDDLLKMLGEIIGCPKALECEYEYTEGHYIRTPYSHTSQMAMKYSPTMHVDLGRGLLELVEEFNTNRHFEG